MKKLLLTIMMSNLALFSASDSESFLKEVRAPKITDAWAQMNGNVTHKREKIVNDKGEVIQKAMTVRESIYLGLAFTNEEIIGKLLFANNELYRLSQDFSAGIKGASSKKEACLLRESNELNDTFGVHVSDLTLSFLFWDYKEELEKDTYNLMSCRVFILENKEIKEYVKVWIKPDWLAPLKVQWFKAGTKVPYRTAEFTKVEKMNDFHMIKRFKITSANSWKTEVSFKDVKAAKNSKEAKPKDLFPKAK